MRLPFGLDFISILVGVILALFVLPRVMAFFTSRSE